MSLQPRNSLDDAVVTDWRMVGIGAGLVGFSVLAIGLCLAAMTGLQPTAPVVPVVEAQRPVFIAPRVEAPAPPELPAAPSESVAPQVAKPVDVDPTPVRRIDVAELTKPAPTRRSEPAVVEEPIPVSTLPPPKVSRLVPYATEPELLNRLKNVREIDLRSEPKAAEALLAAETVAVKKVRSDEATYTTLERSAQDETKLALVATRPDLAGLPLRMGKDCQTSREKSEKLALYSRAIRDYKRRNGLDLSEAESFAAADFRQSGSQTSLNPALRLAEQSAFNESKAAPAAEQVLQADRETVRVGLTRLLAKMEGAEATAALARRALFDLSYHVREEALEALSKRPRSETRQLLSAGFHYPWSPAAANAATALVKLQDREAIASLIEILDQPDPGDPYLREDGRWEVVEMVRINHLRNCQLCHAASFDRKDLVRGIIPTPGEKLPRIYYDSQRGNFVRADVVHLRQDFSVSMPVADAKPWPEVQRFDFITKKTELTAEEAYDLRTRRKDEREARRSAILWTLITLTGIDGGDSPAEWQAALEKQARGE